MKRITKPQRSRHPHAIAMGALLLAAMVAGSAGAGNTNARINEMCPVMTDEQADPSITVEYKGKIVAFCCKLCVGKFTAAPERYLPRLPQFSAESGESPDSKEDAKLSADGGSSVDGVPQDDRSSLLARLHPAIIHFPLAGIPLALIGFCVWAITGSDAFAKADVPPLIVGTLAAIAAVITGNMAHDEGSFSASLAIVAERHQYASTIAMVIALLLVAMRIWRWRRFTAIWKRIYGGVLCVEVALLMVTGYLGASLVYGSDHLKW